MRGEEIRELVERDYVGLIRDYPDVRFEVNTKSRVVDLAVDLTDEGEQA